MNKKGFTLIELLAVIGIIGFLSAITIPRYVDVTDKAKVANVQANLSVLRSSMEVYRAQNEGAGFNDMFYEKSETGEDVTDMFYEKAYSKKKIPEIKIGKNLENEKSGIFAGGLTWADTFGEDVNIHSSAYMYATEIGTGKLMNIFAYLHRDTYGANTEWTKY